MCRPWDSDVPSILSIHDVVKSGNLIYKLTVFWNIVPVFGFSNGYARDEASFGQILFTGRAEPKRVIAVPFGMRQLQRSHRAAEYDCHSNSALWNYRFHAKRFPGGRLLTDGGTVRLPKEILRVLRRGEMP